MSDILSKISGQFTRSVVLGAFLPSVIFLVLALIWLVPLMPGDWTEGSPLSALSPEWKVIAFGLVASLISGLLYILNIPVMRYFEGYPWQQSLLGRWRKHLYLVEFRSLEARWRGLRTLLYACQAANLDRADVQLEFSKVSERFNTQFPHEENLVLPTRLGNTIRSFEVYPFRQYGIDAVNLWPRLVAKIDKDYAGAIDEAKTSFDFMMNTSVLSGGLAMWILLIGLIYPKPFGSTELLMDWTASIIVLVVSAWIAYEMCINRATAWGSMVKSAFDLYRGELLKQLGFSQMPGSLLEERALWRSLSRQMVYGDSPRFPPYPYSARPAARAHSPYETELEYERGSTPVGDGTLRICLRVKNATMHDVQDIAIIDSVPPGYDYEPGSADAGWVRPTVTGANPYTFHLQRLLSGQTATITYKVIPFHFQ